MKLLTPYCNIFTDALPIIFYIAMQILIGTINLHFCTNPSMRAGLGTANVLIGVFGIYLLEGFNQGFIQVASKYLGAKNNDRVTQTIFKGLFTLIFIFIFLIVVGFSSYQLCIFTGQEVQVS
jgi:Na+-driven multidrug efflux pump